MNGRAQGYTQAELDDAQARYELTFPSDLVALLRDRRLTADYDWSTECPQIRHMLEWPFEMLAFDVGHGFWWPDWGERPTTQEECEEVLRSALRRAPRLIPLIVHRFLPEQPNCPGNPVFSMHGFDTIYYGSDLANFISAEFERGPIATPARHISFWTDLVEGFDRAYALYKEFQNAAWRKPGR